MNGSLAPSGICHMDNLRHHLGQGVARARPELSASEQQALVDQMIEFIGNYSGDSRLKPQRTGAAANSRNGRSEEHNTRFEPGAIGFVVCCRPDGKITEVIED